MGSFDLIDPHLSIGFLSLIGSLPHIGVLRFQDSLVSLGFCIDWIAVTLGISNLIWLATAPRGFSMLLTRFAIMGVCRRRARCFVTGVYLSMARWLHLGFLQTEAHLI